MEYKLCPECKRPIAEVLFETATAHQFGSKCRKLLLKKQDKGMVAFATVSTPAVRKSTRVKGHAIKWFVYLDRGIATPYVSTMRGRWDWDAQCECGWDSKTGGGTYSYVKSKVDDHKEEQKVSETD